MAIKRNPKKSYTIRQNIRKFRDAWAENIKSYHEINEFINGYQWDEEQEDLFLRFQKIPMTVNKISPLQNHLIGEQAENTTNLQILPMSEDVAEEAAEIREALIKEITFNSEAKYKYQQMFRQLLHGFTVALVLPEYENDEDFSQCLKIDCLKDPTKAFFDLSAKLIDMRDGMFSGYVTTLSREKFKSVYGDELEKKIGYSSTDIYEFGDVKYSFSDEKTISIVHYFERKVKMKTIYQLSNGDIIDKKELELMEKLTTDDGKEMLLVNGIPSTILNERDIPIYTIVYSVWAGDYKIEESTIPGKWLPCIFGDLSSYYTKDGKQIIRAFFKDAIDSQKYVNYLRTNMAYILKVCRYEQFMASKANIKSADTQAMWRDPSTYQGTLFYDESPQQNKPERLAPPELSQSLIQQYQEASQDIQMSVGMYDTQIGEKGNEISGDAIDARVRRSNFNTNSPRTSLDRLIASIGILVDGMIPETYDTERTMYLSMKDSQNKRVTINQSMDEYGSSTVNDVTKGKFSIRLVPGRSFEEQRDEGRNSMDAVFNKNPETFNLLADLYVENLPMPNNIEMRNRLRTMVPQEIIQAGKTGQPLPPKPQQEDPMITLKKQELQYKMQESYMNMQLKLKDFEIQEQKLMMASHQTGVDLSKELEKLNMQREQIESQMEEQQMRFHAELMRIVADTHHDSEERSLKLLAHKQKVKESSNKKMER